MSNNRFSCLKPPDSIDSSGNPVYGSRNKFKRPKKTNSRWKRSPSPEKNSRFPTPQSSNSFTKPKRDNNSYRDNNRPRYNKGGFGKFRYNHGRRGPSIFDNVKKDNLGRPMLAGATTSGFDINAALKKSKQKPKKEKKKKREIKEDPKLVPFKKEKDEKTEEELKAEAEWNKQMILNMQYEWETESEEDEEDDHDPMTPNTNLV